MYVDATGLSTVVVDVLRETGMVAGLVPGVIRTPVFTIVNTGVLLPLVADGALQLPDVRRADRRAPGRGAAVRYVNGALERSPDDADPCACGWEATVVAILYIEN